MLGLFSMSLKIRLVTKHDSNSMINQPDSNASHMEVVVKLNICVMFHNSKEGGRHLRKKEAPMSVYNLFCDHCQNLFCEVTRMMSFDL